MTANAGAPLGGFGILLRGVIRRLWHACVAPGAVPAADVLDILHARIELITTVHLGDLRK
jgi:hypothetical protein